MTAEEAAARLRSGAPFEVQPGRPRDDLAALANLVTMLADTNAALRTEVAALRRERAERYEEIARLAELCRAALHDETPAAPARDGGRR